MKAIVRHRYGGPDALALRDIDQPTPHDDEILVAVRAASVNPYDWHMMTGTPYLARLSEGLRAPKHPVLGADVAGRVEAVGANVTDFRPGDEVFGQSAGGYAEYACVHVDNVARKPSEVTFEQAASLPIAAVTALQGLRDHGRLRTGQRVAINGASGGVGTFAVQIAKSMGGHVTAVCSDRNTEVVRSLGADAVLDYATTDFLGTGEPYDLILDLIGNRPVLACRRALTRDGSYIAVSTPKDGLWIGPLVFVAKVLLVSMVGGRRMAPMLAKVTSADLAVLAGLLKSGDVTPVIDRTFALHETADALRYVGTGRARGKVVLTC